MLNNAAIRSGLVALGAAGMALALPAQAQTLEELDRLSDLSATEQGGIAAAQDFAGRGDLLQAIATLERVLAVYPESASSRVLHAFYLCAIDDRQGAEVELEIMEEHDIDQAAIDTVRGRCSGASREFPAPTRGTVTVQPGPPPPANNAGAPAPTQSGNQQGARASQPPASTASSSSSGSSAPAAQNSSREVPTTPEDGGEKD